MSRLAEEGLLDRVNSGGFVVRTFGFADVVDAIELRGVLEGTAARLAAERGVGVVEALIRGAIDAGEMAPVDPGAAASIWTAVLIEGGLMVVNAEDKQAAIEAAGEIFDRMLEGLAIAG